MVRAGMSIKKSTIAFQFWINIEKRATKATPIENMICKAIIDLYLFFPTIIYLRNV